MFETRSLTKYFGGLCAINNVDLDVKPGEIVGLLGPNGAGKTTFFNLVTGYLSPTRGQILFEGKDLTGKKPYAIARLGMVRTFQLVRIFENFSVSQNLVAASHLYPKISFWEAILNTRRYRRKKEEISETIMEIMAFLKLGEIKEVVARSLSHGHQKMLGIAIALAARPKLLLLDEPLGGMSTEEVSQSLEIIAKIKKQGTSILLIEHNMKAVMSICDRLMVLNFGTEIGRGSPEEVQKNQKVIQAYLGAGQHAA